MNMPEDIMQAINKILGNNLDTSSEFGNSPGDYQEGIFGPNATKNFDPKLSGNNDFNFGDMFKGSGEGIMGFLGSDGFGNAAKIGQALTAGYLGKKQLDLGKDQLAFQKQAYNDNYSNQMAMTNNRLDDQSNSRKSWNSNYQDTAKRIQERGVA